LLNPNYYGKTNDNHVNTNVSAFEKPSPIEDKKRANTMINKKGSNTTGKPEDGNTNRNNSTVESAKKTNFEKSNQYAKVNKKTKIFRLQCSNIMNYSTIITINSSQHSIHYSEFVVKS